nr:TetR/AcrR family transcriptional regulator [Nocardia bovistercoris]
MDAATAIFYEQGYGRTTFDLVAESARTSKTTLYSRFPTKRDLFSAVVRRSVVALTAQIAAISSDGSVLDRVVATGIAVADATLTPDSIALMRLTAANADEFPDVAQDGFRIGFGECVRCVAEALAGGPQQVTAQVTATAERFVEMALHPLYMHAFFGADLGRLRERARVDVPGVVRIILEGADAH